MANDWKMTVQKPAAGEPFKNIYRARLGIGYFY